MDFIAGNVLAGLAVFVLAAAVAAFPWLALRAAIVWRRSMRSRTVRGLRALDPTAFERAVGAWFARDGWVVEHRGRSGDEGIDLLAFSGDEVVAVQCKRYAEFASVTPAQVRELYGAAAAVGATRAMLVTTGTVANSGKVWAGSAVSGRPRLEFVEGARLAAIADGRERLRR